MKNVMNKFREYFMPHLEVSLPRAFEAAVYGAPRPSKESFAEYTKRTERAFTHLQQGGRRPSGQCEGLHPVLPGRTHRLSGVRSSAFSLGLRANTVGRRLRSP